mmetsp:Transcript_14177/g.29021  ORF Transcript_14177/g.29021 Transcript_14177/m.29021 type:complete len:85 (+) Transcript_14177:46-300(+)
MDGRRIGYFPQFRDSYYRETAGKDNSRERLFGNRAWVHSVDGSAFAISGRDYHFLQIPPAGLLVKQDRPRPLHSRVVPARKSMS